MSSKSDKAVPKIVDFGLTKLLGPQETTKEPYGTVGYIAPEVIRKEPYSYSCDIWSFGCILYILLSSTAPFDCESHETEMINKLITGQEGAKFEGGKWD